MLDGVRPGRAGQGLVELAHAQALEGLRVGEDGLGAEGRDELGGAGDEDVTREDGGGVAPHGLGAGGAASQRGVVHDVVVVERRDVRELDGHAGVPDLLPRGEGGVAQLRGEQGEDRTEPLPAGLREVRGGRVDGLVGVVDDLEQPGLNGIEGRRDPALELRGVQRERSDHGTSIAALLRAVRTTWGRTPRTIVRMTASATAVVMRPSERTMTVPSSGSRKNMSTMRRM